MSRINRELNKCLTISCVFLCDGALSSSQELSLIILIRGHEILRRCQGSMKHGHLQSKWSGTSSKCRTRVYDFKNTIEIFQRYIISCTSNRVRPNICGLRQLAGKSAYVLPIGKACGLLMDSQWLFPLSALSNTPSREISNIPLESELRERTKGIEFLFRVAAQLGLWVNLLGDAATLSV